MKKFIVLGLDPSTDVTGAAFVEFPQGGRPKVMAATAFGATSHLSSSLPARLDRIACTRDALAEWVIKPNGILVPDYALAYEQHTNSGIKTSDALSMAFGAYLTIPRLLGRDLYPITAADARRVYSRTYIKSRDDKKKAAIKWAELYFGIVLGTSPEGEAIADALAVCAAAWLQAKARLDTPVVRPLLGKGSRTK